MRGGALYGMGIHGRVIDIASSDPSDHDTLHSFLSDAEQHEWALYVGTDSGYREVRASAQSPLSRSVMRACRLNGSGSGSGSGAKMVAKMFVNSSRSLDISPKEAFLAELTTNMRVLSAYSADKTGVQRRQNQALTTIRGLAVGAPLSGALFGISVGDDVFFTLQTMCESNLDDMSVFVSRESVHAFIIDALDGLKHVHAAEILHGDVKLDNMMLCGGRHNLIDWGYAASFAETRELCTLTRTPRNCASPMAWFAWGASGAPHGDISQLLHTVTNAKIVRKSVFVLPGFRRLVDGAYESYVARIAALHKSHNGLTAAVRAVVIRDMIPSFDLYNFGLVVASVALSSAVGTSDAPFREAMLDLSTRLMYCAHPEYVGNDAASAAAWWQEKKRLAATAPPSAASRRRV